MVGIQTKNSPCTEKNINPRQAASSHTERPGLWRTQNISHIFTGFLDGQGPQPAWLTLLTPQTLLICSSVGLANTSFPFHSPRRPILEPESSSVLHFQRESERVRLCSEKWTTFQAPELAQVINDTSVPVKVCQTLLFSHSLAEKEA